MLGSGDGRFLITAAKKYGCKAVGYEIDPRLVNLSREAVQKEKLDQLVRVQHEDMFTADLSSADVVVVYLPSPVLQRLLPQMERLKPGSRVLSHQFDLPGVKPKSASSLASTEDGDQHRIFLWTTPFERSAP
jgi:ribosomal protein L11 methylase PrmA